jgi:thiol-disulfide isomerase/thioredoxin
MKYLFTLLFALALIINVEAQDTGIQFSHTDWATTLQQAKAEDKLIFVDCYTDWCGPCKWMTANVFPDDAVGNYYNEKFINVKIDMEKGEGILFAKAYDIRAYPTLMFINAKGEMVHKALGSRPVEDFLTLGIAANDPDQQVGTLMARYEKGERDADFLKNYASAAKGADIENAGDVALDYLASQDDWLTEENMDFIYNMADYYDMDSKLFQYISKNRSAFQKAIGASEVDQRLKYGPYVKIARNKEATDDDMIAAYKAVFPNQYMQFVDEHKMNKLMRANDEEGKAAFFTAAINYMEKYKPEDHMQLNSIAWRFYELTDKPELLEKARAWALKSVTLDSNYMNNDTLAAICFKLKEKDMAAKHAMIAIELAKQDGNEAKETIELLEKINAL